MIDGKSGEVRLILKYAKSFSASAAEPSQVAVNPAPSNATSRFVIGGGATSLLLVLNFIGLYHSEGAPFLGIDLTSIT